MIKKLTVKTTAREQLVDITANVQQLVSAENIKDGICYLYVPHTTAGITINENADPSVKEDIVNQLAKIIPYHRQYLHTEGNADAHIKASLVGFSTFVFVEDNRLVLGTWQGIFFCEFDGPRTRTVYVTVTPLKS